MLSDRRRTILKLTFRSVVALLVGLIVYILVELTPEVVASLEEKEFAEKGYKFVKIEQSRILTMENATLKVEIDQSNLLLRVHDKRNSKVWDFCLTEEDEELNQTWRMFFNSAITLEFVDAQNVTRRAYLTRDAEIIALEQAGNALKFLVNFEELGISFTVSYLLEDDSLTISVDDISERDFKLVSLYLYPFAGATKGLVEGKFVLADGVGAYMDLSKPSTSTTGLKMRVYGDDIGFREVLPYRYIQHVTEPEVYGIPIYGIVLKDSGLLVYIEDGDLYSEINAFKSGIVTPYNWITTRFILRDFHKKLLNKKGEGVTVPQEYMNTLRPRVRFIWLPSGNEFSLVNRFIDEFQRNELTNRKTDRQLKYGLKIDILLSTSKYGAIRFENIVMTSAEKLNEIFRKLEKDKISALVVLHGFSKGGSALSSPRHLPFERLFSNNILKQTYTRDVALYLRYLRVPRTSRSVRKHIIAQNKLEQLMEYENEYIINPQIAREFALKELNEFERMGFSRFIISDVGKFLFSTLNLQRADTLKILHETLSRFPNVLIEGQIWRFVDVVSGISDVPSTYSGYEIEDGELPIVPYILRNFVAVYSRPINLSSNYRRELLKCVEYGIIPSFYLTWENPMKLVGTDKTNIFSSEFKMWYPVISNTYREIFDVLQKIYTLRVIQRERLLDGVYLTTFNDGSQLVVNYSSQPYTYKGERIPPTSWKFFDRGVRNAG